MTDEVVTIGPAPYEESCAQVGTSTYSERSAIECRAFRRMLVRLFPPPADNSAQLIIKRMDHDFGTYREVGVRYSGKVGMEYALQVERHMPGRWDATAREELIWYTVRYLMSVLVNRKWIAQTDIPYEFALLEPPNPLTKLLSGRDALFSPSHRGGPFEPRLVDGVFESDVFGAPEQALILGPLDSYFGRGLVILLGQSDLRLYRPDLLGAIAYLSDDFKSDGAFLIRDGSPGAYALTSADTSKLCSPMCELKFNDRDGRSCQTWRLLPSALKEATAISLAPRLESSHKQRR